MEHEEPMNVEDEKDVCGDNDVEVIRRVLDEIVESRMEIICEHDLVCVSDSGCWKETGIKLLSDSKCRIFDGEMDEREEGPPKKRKKGASDSSSDWNDERAKIRAVAVDADFIQKFS